MEDYYNFKHKESFGVVMKNKIGRLEFNKLENTLSMKNLKEGLIQYLKKNGKQEDVSYRELYDMYPFDGHNLTNKQQGDRVRSIWKKMKRSNERIYDLIYKDSFRKDNVPEVVLESIVTIGEPEKKTTQAIHKTGKVTVDPQMGTTALPEVIAKPIRKEAQPFVSGNYLVLGCVHAPFVNKVFWNTLCNYAKENKHQIKGIILNGDFLDLNALSSHDRGRMPLKGWDLGKEYSEARKLLTKLVNNLNPNIYKAFLYGNHEDRFLRYMSYPDAQKLNGAIPSPEQGLQLDSTWNVFTNWKHDEIQLGNLTIIHGEFFNVHLCKKYLDVFKKNMMFAHSHRQQLYREGEYAAYNIGCMLDVNSPVFSYASKAMKKSWANGFALATVDNGKTNVQLITWNKDHFRIGNEKYK